jgi:hypothetical protein
MARGMSVSHKWSGNCMYAEKVLIIYLSDAAAMAKFANAWKVCRERFQTYE